MVSECVLILESQSKDRGVAFLDYPANRHVNARHMFQVLSLDEQRRLRTSFDYWIQGLYGQSISKRFHGWQASHMGGKYRNCFVFKEPPHRLYGFLAKAQGNL